jgi:transcriptional regulator with XRE-family HTH domain
VLYYKRGSFPYLRVLIVKDYKTLVNVPCPCPSCTDEACARLNTSTSTRDNSTTKAPIDDAIADLESREAGEDFTLQEIATKHGVTRSTLSRRWRGVTRSNNDGYSAQQTLSPQQEYELVLYIEQLTSQGLSPTRTMVQNFASTIAKKPVSESWVTAFIHQKQQRYHLKMDERYGRCSTPR